jgi:hypothetical protein
MIEPLQKTITLPDGTERVYIISKFDAVTGRYIVSQYPVSGLPKVGDYETNEKIMLRMMQFVAVPGRDGADALPLQTRELVNNHVPEWETLAKLEWALMEYNCSFFAQGKVSGFLDDLLEALPASILSMLTPLLDQLSAKNSQLSES